MGKKGEVKRLIGGEVIWILILYARRVWYEVWCLNHFVLRQNRSGMDAMKRDPIFYGERRQGWGNIGDMRNIELAMKQF